MAVVHETKRQADLQLAQAVSVLSRSAWHWLDHIRTETFADRQAVHDVAAGAKHYDSTAVERLEEALKAVPLHSLVSPEWVVNVLSAIATLERARRHIDKAVELHRQMDAETFNRFFTSLDRMSKALEDITTQLNNGVIALKG